MSLYYRFIAGIVFPTVDTAGGYECYSGISVLQRNMSRDFRRFSYDDDVH